MRLRKGGFVPGTVIALVLAAIASPIQIGAAGASFMVAIAP